MKRRSWIVLGLCILIAAGLGFAFIATQSAPQRLTEQDAIEMTRRLETAFEHKNANAIMDFISPAPETRIAGITNDQLRILLSRYFRNSDRLSAQMSNYVFDGGDTDATLQFDIAVHNDGPDSQKMDYPGHITLHLKRVDVPHLLGLYQTREWRIVGADTTGPDLSAFGD